MTAQRIPQAVYNPASRNLNNVQRVQRAFDVRVPGAFTCVYSC